MSEKYRPLLLQYNKLIKNQIQMIEGGGRLASYHRQIQSREKEVKKQLLEYAHYIAKTGQVNNQLWTQTRNYFITVIKDVLDRFQTQFKDSKTFQEEKEVILQYLVFFQSPPFTIQRIAQLTLQPQKYYKSCRKLLYAYEKLVNVSDPQDK